MALKEFLASVTWEQHERIERLRGAIPRTEFVRRAIDHYCDLLENRDYVAARTSSTTEHGT